MTESISAILADLQEAIAVNQCAEDSATEGHIKKALGVVNGSLLNVAGELIYLIERQEETRM